VYDAKLVRTVDYTTDPITQKVKAIMEDETTTTTTVQSFSLGFITTTKSTITELPSICFVICRPGCMLCREHAGQLVNLLSLSSLSSNSNNGTTMSSKSKFQLWVVSSKKYMLMIMDYKHQP
jgi:hypothetical protein